MAAIEARDLLITPFYEGDSWGTLDLTLRASPEGADDLATAMGPDSLRQALVLRLLTPQGSLGSLGHAAYGSRLHELIGRQADETTRQLARSYTLRALVAEPRVESVLGLEVEPPAQLDQESIRIHAFVQMRDIDDPIELGIEVAL